MMSVAFEVTPLGVPPMVRKPNTWMAMMRALGATPLRSLNPLTPGSPATTPATWVP